jgi:hypothetical protein
MRPLKRERRLHPDARLYLMDKNVPTRVSRNKTSLFISKYHDLFPVFEEAGVAWLDGKEVAPTIERILRGELLPEEEYPTKKLLARIRSWGRRFPTGHWMVEELPEGDG